MKKVKIIQCGPDSIYKIEEKLPINCKWCVYWYEIGSYEGHGYAYCYADKKYYAASLGHCSCYGPIESADYWTETNKKEILERDIIGEDQMSADFRKVFKKIFRSKK